MSKKVLKEQHPWANINYIDYLSFLDPSKTNKFLPFMIKELKRSIEDRNERNRDDIKYMVREIAKQFRIDETVLYGMDYDMLTRIQGILDMFGSDKVNILRDFYEHLENKRIEKNDISQYKSFDEIREQVKIASFKQAQKELRGATHVVYEDENYLMIKPLTFLSSTKYGATTKWCTTMENNNHYFYDYSSNGVLIYIFNKVNNVKVAAHIRLQYRGRYDNPIKFYNEQDVETDSYVLGLSKNVMEKLMEEYRISKTNSDFIKENYPEIYEKDWTKRNEEKVNEWTTEAVEDPMVEDGMGPTDEVAGPTLVEEEPNIRFEPTLLNHPNQNLITADNGIGQISSGDLCLSGPINLDEEATESLREKLFQGQNDVEDIIKKVNEYTKTSKLKNLWRKLFGPKVVVVGVPEGTMPYEKWDELGNKLNEHTGDTYKFIVVWTYNSKEMTFTTL
jgi:hypothetical protein